MQSFDKFSRSFHGIGEPLYRSKSAHFIPFIVLLYDLTKGIRSCDLRAVDWNHLEVLLEFVSFLFELLLQSTPQLPCATFAQSGHFKAP